MTLTMLPALLSLLLACTTLSQGTPVCQVCNCILPIKQIDCRDENLVDMPSFEEVAGLYKYLDIRGNQELCGQRTPSWLRVDRDECPTGKYLNSYKE